MKRIFVCLLILTALSTYTNAQEVPAVELFGGYSYNRIKPDFLAEWANTNGWHANVAVNKGFIAFVADFSGHYGKSAGTNLSMTSSLFGVRFARRGKNITWFVQSMYGFSAISADGDIFGPEIGRFDQGFAFSPGGGGIDVKLGEKIAIRLFQYDLISTNLGRGGGQLHSRASTGIVIRLGRR
jgi:hypothetical protein